MYPLDQGAAVDLPFFAFDEKGDGVSALANGDWSAKRVRLPGTSAFADLACTVTPLEAGWYRLQAAAGAVTASAGIAAVYFTADLCKQVNLTFRVVATSPDGLATAAGVAAAEAALDASIDGLAARVGAGLGDGAVQVDHDYGGADALRCLDGAGRPIDDAVVEAYLAADWTAGRRSSDHAVARTLTRADGRWAASLALDAGAYKLVVFKQGTNSPVALDLAVAAPA